MLRFIICLIVCFGCLVCNGQEHVSLYLRDSVYNKEIEDSDKIIDTVYRNDKLNEIIFPREVVFRVTTFLKEADFTDAIFQKGASFLISTFEKVAYFNRTRFQKRVYFAQDTFQQAAIFRFAAFQKKASFHSATFRKEASFSGATFQNDVDLSKLQLTDSSQFDFQGARLPDRLDFSYNAIIKNEIDVTIADLDRDTLYTLKQKRWHYINLYKSDISKIKIDYRHFRFLFCNTEELDTIIRESGADSIIFAGKKYYSQDTAIVTALWSNSIFKDYICHVFPGCRYYRSDGFFATLRDKFMLHFWKEYLSAKYLNTKMPAFYDSAAVGFTLSCIENVGFPRQLPDDEILSIYQQEIKILADRGATLSKQNLDIEYHDFINRENFIPHIWNCYGYHKEWVFYWAGMFLVFFTVITFCFLPFLSGKVYSVSFFKPEDVKLRTPKATVAANGWYSYFMQPEETPKGSSFSQRLGGRIWYSIVYTSVIFFLFSLKIDNFKFTWKFSHILGSIYVLLMYTAGITCLAYMANFVLQK